MQLFAFVLALAPLATALRVAPLVPNRPLMTSVTHARATTPRLDFGGPQYKMDAKEGEVADVPFEIRFSLGNLISVLGVVLFVFCIGKFLLNSGESDVISTFGFVYAIPALVGGLALKLLLTRVSMSCACA